MKHYLYVTIITLLLMALPSHAQQMSDLAAGRFLDQATFGPSPAAITQIEQMGISGWLSWQFSLNVSNIPDQPILNGNGSMNNNFIPVEQVLVQNAVSQPDQLRQRIAWGLTELWVVSNTSRTVLPPYAIPPYWRIFRDNAFGNYRDIIKAMTLSPAMGKYLNMANNPLGTGTYSPNENYARELMQLFTIGLTQLNPDGTQVLDTNGHPIPTYTQAQVTDTAKVLTGWTYPTAPHATPKPLNPPYYFGVMFPVETNHDKSQKTIVGGTIIPANQTSSQDLDMLLNALMAQSSMAPFVSRQLIQQMVTSNPTPAYVQRVSSVFSNDGNGVTGNMQAVITAILTDPEARAGDNSNYQAPANFGHLREPLLFVCDVLYGLNAVVSPQNTFYKFTFAMGQDLWNPPTVFSYYSPQYEVAPGLLGPEFQIYSAQTALNRANFINQMLYKNGDGVSSIDLSPFTKFTGNTVDLPGLLDYVSYVFLHHNMSDNLKQAATAATSGLQGDDIAKAVLYIVLTSSEYDVIQ